jgi:D-alanyl-D-alanine carboxypeptidase
LAAYQIGQESEGIYLNADVSMPLASVVKIINLVAYAEGVAAQQLDPATWIPLSDIERFYLPRVDLGAHPRALSDLEERNLIAPDPPSTPLEELPGMMIRYSSNAASDFLHLAVGQEKIETTAVNLGLTTQTAPCPWVGQDLIMANHLQSSNNRQAVQAFVDDPAAYGQEVMRLTELFANDEAFREEEIAWHRRRPSSEIWRLFGENLNARASAGDYAGLMAKIIQNDVGEPFVNILVRRALEWPLVFSSNQALFSTIGYKDGSLPGILTTVYYAQRIEDSAQVVVALFFRDLPENTYRQWRQDLPHDELARWILADPEAIPALRKLMGSG